MFLPAPGPLLSNSLRNTARRHILGSSWFYIYRNGLKPCRLAVCCPSRLESTLQSERLIAGRRSYFFTDRRSAATISSWCQKGIVPRGRGLGMTCSYCFPQTLVGVSECPGIHSCSIVAMLKLIVHECPCTLLIGWWETSVWRGGKQDHRLHDL